MKVLAVLSYQMSADCILDEESTARAMLAIKTFKKGGYEFLTTIGWAYRTDCSTAISDVVANFIKSNSNIEKYKIISNMNSRDTVGDAYFLRQQLKNYNYSDILVVTSDYHMKRAKIIFEKIFNGISNISIIGAVSKKKDKPSIISREEESIKAFEKTFAGVDFNDLDSIYLALTEKHPFYNGNIYPKLNLY